MSTLFENIKHLASEAKLMVLNEAPQGWLVHHIPAEIFAILGDERQYFIDLGFEDWPDAKTVGNTYLMAIAKNGLNIPNTSYSIRSPRTHELTIDPGRESLQSLRDDWLTYVQLIDFHRKGDPVVWFGHNVRSDRRASDFDAHPERFENDRNGWKRTDDLQESN